MIGRLIYDPLSLGGAFSHLEQEYRAHPIALRLKWLKQCLRLRALLFLSGQSRLRVKQFPANTKKVLYAYDWGAIGDSIMDLSQRQIFPAEVDLDLYMPAKASVLFEGDSCFEHIYRDPADCPSDYDLIILHNISPALVRFKKKYYPQVPYYDVLGCIQGELYDRARFCHASLLKLLNLSNAPLYRPQLGETYISGMQVKRHTVAVVMGAMDASRRHYSDWQAVLSGIKNAVHAEAWESIRFVLIGSGESARNDVERLNKSFVESYCDVNLDLSSLEDVKRQIALCEYFIGADGGLMHIAQALHKPGIALFAEIDPAWRMVDSFSSLKPLWAPRTVSAIPAPKIVSEFLSIVTKAKYHDQKY